MNNQTAVMTFPSRSAQPIARPLDETDPTPRYQPEAVLDALVEEERANVAAHAAKQARVEFQLD